MPPKMRGMAGPNSKYSLSLIRAATPQTARRARSRLQRETMASDDQQRPSVQPAAVRRQYQRSRAYRQRRDRFNWVGHCLMAFSGVLLLGFGSWIWLSIGPFGWVALIVVVPGLVILLAGIRDLLRTMGQRRRSREPEPTQFRRELEP